MIEPTLLATLVPPFEFGTLLLFENKPAPFLLLGLKAPCFGEPRPASPSPFRSPPDEAIVFDTRVNDGPEP